MTKKEMKQYLAAAGIRGYSRALITFDTGWITCGDYAGKIDNSLNRVVMKPIDLTSKQASIVVNFNKQNAK